MINEASPWGVCLPEVTLQASWHLVSTKPLTSFCTGNHDIQYFWSEINIWNVNCAQATAFIFDTRTGVLVKVSKFLRQKMYRPEGDSNPNLRIHAECSNLLSYQGQTFAVPCFEYWLGQYRYFWSKVNIWNVNCARATAFIFQTRTGVLVKVSNFLRQKMSQPGGGGDSNPQPLDSCRML